MAMGSKYGNSSIFMRQVFIIFFYKEKYDVKDFLFVFYWSRMNSSTIHTFSKSSFCVGHFWY